MAKRFLATIIAAMFLCFVSCSEDDSTGPNELGGSTDLELTKVGNDYGAYISVNGEDLNLEDSVWISQSDNGIVTIRVKVDISEVPENFRALIPEQYKGGDGNIDAELKFKVTSEGIQDFYHSENDLSKPFTIIKYDAGVGDKYEFTRADGRNVTRTVTRKSTDDDYEMGFIYIKTFTTEEVSTGDDVEKVEYMTNHKFGLVNVKICFKAGIDAEIQLIPWAMVI